MIVATWNYEETELLLSAVNDELAKTGVYKVNGEWDLIATRISTSLDDELTLRFIIKRKPAFLVVNILLPIIFMAFVNLLVFVLPVECGERVGFAVTILLALVVFLTLVGDNLPNTSEQMSLLGFYLLVVLILSILMTVATAFNLQLYYKQGNVPSLYVRLMKLISRRFRQKTIAGSQKVYPIIDIDENQAPTKTDENHGIESTFTPDITWQDVSFAADMVCLVVFCAAFAITHVFFLHSLTNNTN